ncbi:hypothetical protein GCM10020295_08550 [Streptomyces cinereospinus]
MLAVFDTDLRLMRANAGMERTLSLPEAVMRGLRLPDIAPDPVSDETERRMRLALETGEPQQVRAFARRTGAGAAHDWATTLAPLRDADGRVRAVCLTAHDRAAQEGDRQQAALPHEADVRIGTTLNSARTAQELSDVVVPRLADFVAVDLLDPPPRGDTPSPAPAPPVTLCRTAVRSVLEGSPELPVGIGGAAVYPPLSPPAECLAAGRGAVYGADHPAVAQWVAQDPRRRGSASTGPTR